MRRIMVTLSLTCMLQIGVVRTESQSQTPILDKVANKVIQKYQGATCEQLWAERAQKASQHRKSKELFSF
jgi:hypothetical protein